MLPAAVLSGAPMELEARTVRYDLTTTYILLGLYCKACLLTLSSKHLQAGQACHSERHLDWNQVADGLGCAWQGSPMGESSDGMAVVGRFHARDAHPLQVEGGRHRLRRQAGLRVLRSRTQRAKDRAEGLCQQLLMVAEEAEAYPDKVTYSSHGSRPMTGGASCIYGIDRYIHREVS